MSEVQEAIVTLYSVVQDPMVLIDACKKRFEEATKEIEQEETTLTLILQDDSAVIIHVQNDPAILEKQITGMRSFYASVPTKHTELLKGVLLQIEAFTCTTSISFFLNEDEDRTSFILGSIFEVAQDSASIVLYPNMSLFTPKGDLLLTIEGKSEVSVWHPIAHQSILQQKLTYKKEDQQRFEKIKKELSQKGFPCVSNLLSTQLNIDGINVPSIEEIARRCICLFSCALCAECTLAEGGSRTLGISEYEHILNTYPIETDLTDKERAFLYGQEPEEIVSMQFTWKYESCAVLLWALGLYEIDSSFQSLCDVPTIAKTIRSFTSIEALCQQTRRRSDAEILELHTRVLYYDWSCVEAHIHNQQLKGIEPGVIQEFHHALNWLCSACDTRNWDAIVCNT